MNSNPLISLLIVCFIAASPTYVAADDCKKSHGFSINEAGDQVWFAPGNLQYQASTNTWRFAERQFDRCGDGKADNTTVYYTDKDGNRKLCNNNDASATYEGWIDIFGWGTSGYKGCIPWMTHDNDADYGPAEGTFDVNSGDNRNYDWGFYNDIYEGTKKHPKGTWRTPTNEEWYYVMYKRKVNGQAGFSVVDLKYDPSYESMYGYILYPDIFSFRTAGVAPIAVGEKYRTTISLATWQALEQAGCVFLPATCHREANSFPYTSLNGNWHTPWSSTSTWWGASRGLPVRLITDKTIKRTDTIVCGKTYTWDLEYKKVSITAPGEYYDTLRNIFGADSIIFILHLITPSPIIKHDTFVSILQGETFRWEVNNKSYNESGNYHDTLRNACGWDSIHFTLHLRVYNPCEKPAFSINDNGDKVLIAPGNLQYKPSTQTWRFAEHQYDFIGENNCDVPSDYADWIDLFGWGTSGKGTIPERSDPLGASPDVEYGPPSSASGFNVNDFNSYYYWSYDWGYSNEIYEGEIKHPKRTWHTLTEKEWKYLFFTREENSGEKAYSASISIGNVSGIILYPDGFTIRGGSTIDDGTQLTQTQWADLEDKGCAFLPAAGSRHYYRYPSDTELKCRYMMGDENGYWASTCKNGYNRFFYYLRVKNDAGVAEVRGSGRSDIGYSVRLAREAKESEDSETKLGSDIIDTLRCGNTYIWDLGYKLREITQTENEKEYTDTLRVDCGEFVSKLKLVLKPLVAETNEKTEFICAGDKYTWNLGYTTREVERENDYFDTLRSVQGCDSVISILHLTVQRPVDDDYSGVIHCGETYEWDYGYGKEDITEPGVYTREKKDEATGCVSIVSTLHLMFSADDVELTEEEGVIEGCAYTWELSDGRKRELNEEGDYYDTIREGTCDKVIAHLKLVLKEKPQDPCDQPTFSINADGGKVLLAPGNLQYQASTDTWRFAPTQYDRIGKDNENISETYAGWIDLFGWGTSGKGTDVARSYPWLTSSTNSAYGPSSGNFDVNSGDNRSFDWGYLNEIYAGETKYPAGTWRTPTKDEWQYLLTTRKVNSADPYSFVRIQYGDKTSDTVTGVIIYPDGFTFANACMSAIATGASAGITPINAKMWKKMERAGCAFLPGASYRDGTSVKDYFGINANYWASTANGSNNAYKVKFYLQNGRIEAPGSDGRKYAFPVRLVKDYDATATAIHKNFDGTVLCGQHYDWVLEDGRTISIPPQKEDEKDYYDTLLVGCDSIISHLKLVVEQPTPTSEYDTAAICGSKPYIWTYDKTNGQTREFRVTGDYDTTLKDIHGCDSVIMHLHLIFSDIVADQRESSATIERGDSYEWKITDKKTRYITTQGDHHDTVRSVYGCDSIISILHLTVTSTEPYEEPVYDTICNTNTYEWIREGTKLKDISQTTEKGTYRDTIRKKVNGKDSIYCILYLTRLETKTKPTDVSVCIGKRYDWYTTDRLAPHLSILVEGDYSNQQTIPFKNYRGCDSVVYTLNITAKNCQGCVPLKKLKPIPPKDVCADSVSFNYMFRYVAGQPSTYSVKFDAKAIADGFANIEGQFEPENIFDTLAILPVNIPQIEPYIRPWSYKILLNITDTCGKEYKFTDSLHVFYPSKIIDQHWNDVLALFNSRYNGGYEFSAYQWYIDNSPIYGATRDHYYFPANLSETSKYRALLTRYDDGYTTFTCPVTVTSRVDASVLNEPYIYVHPTFVPKEEPIIQIVSNLEGNFWIYDMAGKMVSLGEFRSYDMKKGATLVRLPSVQSAYLVYLIPKDKKHIKEKSYIVIVR